LADKYPFIPVNCLRFAPGRERPAPRPTATPDQTCYSSGRLINNKKLFKTGFSGDPERRDLHGPIVPLGLSWFAQNGVSQKERVGIAGRFFAARK
jgi:hypothetical protein